VAADARKSQDVYLALDPITSHVPELIVSIRSADYGTVNDICFFSRGGINISYTKFSSGGIYIKGYSIHTNIVSTTSTSMVRVARRVRVDTDYIWG
jgi:hypothetical protein